MAEDSLRRALTYGADRVVLLTVRFFAGSDTLATSYALSMAIQKVGATWGTPASSSRASRIDGDTAQVGPGIAKRLGLTQLTYVSKVREVDVHAGSIVLERRAEGGTQVLSSRLTALITMLDGSQEIRRGSMDDALRAARAAIVKWSAHDAGIGDLSKCGLKGSPTVVKKVYAPSARSEKAHIISPHAPHSPAVLADALLDAIFEKAPALEHELSPAE